MLESLGKIQMTNRFDATRSVDLLCFVTRSLENSLGETSWIYQFKSSHSKNN